MNIKTRLSFQFTFLVFGILLIFSGMVYYFSIESQKMKFNRNLLERAQNTAILLINVVEVDSTLLKKIHQTTKSLVEEEIVLTDSAIIEIYSNNTKYLVNEILPKYVTPNSPFYFSIGNKDGIAYKHLANNQFFYVFVLAYDQFRADNLRGLRTILIWSIIFSIFLSVSVSYVFSRLAILPISRIIVKMKSINSFKLNSRLDEGSRKDEIEQLAVTFNEMLTNLEKVFRSQDEFVSNASHELRTPLAIMIAETDYILGKVREPQEYSKHLKEMSHDLRKLNNLLSSLLELANLNRENVFPKSLIRVDELVFNAIQSLKSKYQGRKIIPKIEFADSERDMQIEGNSSLLEMALKNLIDNACKFSKADVDIKVSSATDFILISITDSGIGIPDNEIENIFKPFTRAINSKNMEGFGIGLSIVQKIIEMHFAEIKVRSKESEGTVVEIRFKKRN